MIVICTRSPYQYDKEIILKIQKKKTVSNGRNITVTQYIHETYANKRGESY